MVAASTSPAVSHSRRIASRPSAIITHKVSTVPPPSAVKSIIMRRTQSGPIGRLSCAGSRSASISSRSKSNG